jgi:hypothetical protein
MHSDKKFPPIKDGEKGKQAMEKIGLDFFYGAMQPEDGAEGHGRRLITQYVKIVSQCQRACIIGLDKAKIRILPILEGNML